VRSTRYAMNWSFAARRRSAAVSPMKSVPLGPNWSFARFQGSWFRGAGRRSGSGGGGSAVRWSIRRVRAYSGLRPRQLACVFFRRAVWQSSPPQAR
jgi:hypothetical protein